MSGPILLSGKGVPAGCVEPLLVEPPWSPGALGSVLHAWAVIGVSLFECNSRWPWSGGEADGM
jgi:hypothetical protein